MRMRGILVTVACAVAFAPTYASAQDAASSPVETDTDEDGEQDDERLASPAQMKLYRDLSIAGNVLTDTSMALLVTSFWVVWGQAIGCRAGGCDCDPEFADCSRYAHVDMAWKSLFILGMATFTAGFPVLYAAISEAEDILWETRNELIGYRGLRITAWIFYGLSVTSAIISGFLGIFGWGELVPTTLMPAAIGSAMIATSLNFHAWRKIKKKLRSVPIQASTVKMTAAPFVAPVSGGVLAGIGGTF